MGAQNNVETARAMYDAFSRGDLDAAAEQAADDVEVSFVPTGQLFRGRAGFVDFMRGHRAAFPDIRIEVTNQIAAGDDLVNEFVAHGTHTGPLATPTGDIPPTGRSVTISVCEVQRYRDGKLISIHNYQDLASVLQQLGLTG
jgi:steroid delta-isomerase-like uncharacterized protein